MRDSVNLIVFDLGRNMQLSTIPYPIGDKNLWRLIPIMSNTLILQGNKGISFVDFRNNKIRLIYKVKGVANNGISIQKSNKKFIIHTNLLNFEKLIEYLKVQIKIK